MLERPESRFFFVGNDRCLDFVNTTVILNGVFTDLLCSFADLVDWCVAAGVVGDEAGATLRAQAAPDDAGRALAEARALRAEIRHAAEAAAGGKDVPPSAVGAVNDVLRRGPRYTQLRGHGRVFQKELVAPDLTPDGLLVPVAEAAATLLAERDLGLVKRCANPACILFFYDTSKNHARRWCSMEVCGNRMKVAAHHRRQKEGA